MSYEKGFQRGDHLIVPIKKLGVMTRFMHHGIYCGDEMVVHYDEDSNSIKKVRLEKFSEGNIDEIHELYYSNPPFNQEDSAKRAENLCKLASYDLINYNCEHIAYYCKTGIWASKQVETALNNIGILGTGGKSINASTGANIAIRTTARKSHPVIKVAVLGLLSVFEGAEYLLQQGKPNQAAAGKIQVREVDEDRDGDVDYLEVTV